MDRIGRVLCITAKRGHRCPSWVNSVDLAVRRSISGLTPTADMSTSAGFRRQGPQAVMPGSAGALGLLPSVRWKSRVGRDAAQQVKRHGERLVVFRRLRKVLHRFDIGPNADRVNERPTSELQIAAVLERRPQTV